jgi:arylsulfatase A-like enzyme
MAKSDRPNMLVMWGDDIGISNLSCYSDGLVFLLDYPLTTNSPRVNMALYFA